MIWFLVETNGLIVIKVKGIDGCYRKKVRLVS